jgi:hypothetical protein
VYICFAVHSIFILRTLETAVATAKANLDIEGMKIPNQTHPDAPLGPESAARIVEVLNAPSRPGLLCNVFWLSIHLY